MTAGVRRLCYTGVRGDVDRIRFDRIHRQEHLDMTRQGVTQHLDLLEAANLVATVRRGREKLHFLNPVPLQEIYERWIAKFEKPRLKALSKLKRRLERTNG
jgi:DNA-binding transcriptional ArsR family regulator